MRVTGARGSESEFDMTPGVLLDIDGVLTQGGRAIDGAAAAVQELRDAGHPLLFVTNTTSRARGILAQDLRRVGFELEVDEILDPMVAAKDWIVAHDRAPAAIVVSPTSRPDLEGIEVDEDAPKALVLGDLGEGWSYAELNRVLGILLDNPDCALLALGGTRYWRAADGWRLDVGPFAAMFSMAADREAVICGKPARDFFHSACRRIGCDPADVVMVGDDVVSDVGGAIDAGLRGILVRTGKFREADLTRGVDPEVVIRSVADLPAHLRF